MAKLYMFKMRECPFHPPVEVVDQRTGPRDVSPVVAIDPATTLCFVTCPVCQCRGPLGDSVEAAVDLWNTAYVKKAEDVGCQSTTVG